MLTEQKRFWTYPGSTNYTHLIKLKVFVASKDVCLQAKNYFCTLICLRHIRV